PTTFNPLTGLPTGSLGTPHSPFTWTRAPKQFYAPRPSRRILLWAPWCGNGSRNAWNSRADGRRQGKVSPPAPPPDLCRRQEEVKSSHPVQCLVVTELWRRVPSRTRRCSRLPTASAPPRCGFQRRLTRSVGRQDAQGNLHW